MSETQHSQQELPDGDPQPCSSSTCTDDPPSIINSRAVQVNITRATNEFGCQVNTRGIQLLKTSVATQTPNVCFCDKSTQCEVQTEASEPVSPEASPTKSVNDPNWVPESGSEDTEDEDHFVDLKGPEPQYDSKYLVFENELLKLFKRCQECGAPIDEAEKIIKGSQYMVTCKCIYNHNITWESQPTIKGIAAGNLLLSAAILFSGSTYTKVATLSEILKLKIFSEKTFHNIQDEYLFPVINEFWEQEQISLFHTLKEKQLWLSGDGRCDSPGHNAKYGTYTMLDQETDKIIDFNVVQVSEVNNSNAMEREGFKRCMDNIKGKGGQVKVVATDRHVGIRADIKRLYPEVEHQFDVWHLSKSITKKLNEKAKKRIALNFHHGLRLLSLAGVINKCALINIYHSHCVH